MAKMSPQDGGCWFCYQDEEKEGLAFDTEFDTYVHLSCLKDTLRRKPNHPEARCMTYLLPKEDVNGNV